jgi:hypothetical protein
MGEKLPSVGILHSNKHLVSSLELSLQRWGFSTEGQSFRDIRTNPSSYGRFLSRFDPTILIFDINEPYLTEDWKSARDLRRIPQSRGRAIVYTTLEKSRLDDLVGPTLALDMKKRYSPDLVAVEVFRIYGALK